MDTNPDYLPPAIALPVAFLLVLILLWPSIAFEIRKIRRNRRLRSKTSSQTVKMGVNSYGSR